MPKVALTIGAIVAAVILTSPLAATADAKKGGQAKNKRAIHHVVDLASGNFERTGMALEDIHGIVLLGSARRDIREVNRKSLRLSAIDGPSIPAKSVGPRRDMNGDGFRDLIVYFDRSQLAEIYGGNDLASHSVISGATETPQGGGGQVLVDTFEIALPTGDNSSPLANCTPVMTAGSSPTLAGMRCIFSDTTAPGFFPLDVVSLVAEMNADLESQGESKRIVDSSKVVFEVYGGNGAEGKSPDKPKSCPSRCLELGGSGGPHGYSILVQPYSRVTKELDEFSSDGLYIFPGESGKSHNAGGSSTIVALRDFTGDSVPQLDPTAAGLTAVAGGGGGGASGVIGSDCLCLQGGNGGIGGGTRSIGINPSTFIGGGGSAWSNDSVPSEGGLGGGESLNGGQCIGPNPATLTAGIGGAGGINRQFGSINSSWKAPLANFYNGGVGDNAFFASPNFFTESGAGGGGCGGGTAGDNLGGGGAGGGYVRDGIIFPETLAPLDVGNKMSIAGEAIITFEVLDPS